MGLHLRFLDLPYPPEYFDDGVVLCTIQPLPRMEVIEPTISCIEMHRALRGHRGDHRRRSHSGEMEVASGSSPDQVVGIEEGVSDRLIPLLQGMLRRQDLDALQ